MTDPSRLMLPSMEGYVRYFAMGRSGAVNPAGVVSIGHSPTHTSGPQGDPAFPAMTPDPHKSLPDGWIAVFVQRHGPFLPSPDGRHGPNAAGPAASSRV